MKSSKGGRGREWRGVVCSRLNCFTSDITTGVEFYGPVVKPRFLKLKKIIMARNKKDDGWKCKVPGHRVCGGLKTSRNFYFRMYIYICIIQFTSRKQLHRSITIKCDPYSNSIFLLLLLFSLSSKKNQFHTRKSNNCLLDCALSLYIYT